jgi:hypothetical protein
LEGRQSWESDNHAYEQLSNLFGLIVFRWAGHKWFHLEWQFPLLSEQFAFKLSLNGSSSSGWDIPVGPTWSDGGGKWQAGQVGVSAKKRPFGQT